MRQWVLIVILLSLTIALAVSDWVFIKTANTLYNEIATTKEMVLDVQKKVDKTIKKQKPVYCEVNVSYLSYQYSKDLQSKIKNGDFSKYDEKTLTGILETMSQTFVDKIYKEMEKPKKYGCTMIFTKGSVFIDGIKDITNEVYEAVR